MKAWSFRIVHICGALILDYGLFADDRPRPLPAWLSYTLLILAGYALYQVFLMQQAMSGGAQPATSG